MAKKILSIILATVLLLSALTVCMIPASAAATDEFFKSKNFIKFYSEKANSCIETYGGGTNPGATVDLWWDYDGECMYYKFIRTAADSDYFRIQIKGATTVMMPKESSTEPGTAITLGTVNEADDSQLWSLRALENGNYMLINKASDLAMCLKGNSTSSGALIIIDTVDESNAYSHWNLKLIKPEPVPFEASVEKKFLNVGETTNTIPNTDVSEITYSSTDNSVATVDADGKVTAIGSGSATIIAAATVTDEDTGITGQETSYCQIIVGGADKQGSLWNITSPDGNVKAVFALDAVRGTIIYAAFDGDELVIEPSPTGLTTSLGDFTNGISFVSRQDEVINESYELIGAKVKNVDSHANQTTLNFAKNGVSYGMIIRAYDDGIAFRYIINAENVENPFNISYENTGFKIPVDATVTAYPYSRDNEDLPEIYGVSSLKGDYSMPMTYQTDDDSYVLVSEAVLEDTYCGAKLVGHSNGMVDIRFSPEQTTDVVTGAPFQSPWRFAVIGTLSDITLNTMAENLSPACKIEDTSWIVPGPMAWTWVNGDPCNDGETYKRYVDLCAEAGWKYLLMDEGWNKGGRGTFAGYYDWTEELIEYANSKGIGLIVWAHKLDLDTPEEQARIKEWADMGFKGFKPDFFSSSSQESIHLINTLIKLAAENKMLIDHHGIYKPAGERRTYPNQLAREALSASEGRVNYAYYACTLPFTRIAIGPADYAPMASFGNVFMEQYNEATLAGLAAEAILYECGIQCLADKPDVYRSSPAFDFYKNLPTSWDESVLVDGEIGNYVNMARRAGDNWYMGIMCDAKRDAQFSLDFLDDNTIYNAVIYKDGATKRDIAVEQQLVTNEDTLTIPLLRYGGAAIKITPVFKSMEIIGTTVAGKDFTIDIVTSDNVNKIKVFNEAGNKIGISSLTKEAVQDGIHWTLTLSVATAGKGRTLSVQAETNIGTDSRNVVFDVAHQEPAVLSASFNAEAVKVNEIFQTTVITSSGISKVDSFNEFGRAMGKALVSKTINLDGTITWIFNQSIGSSGENRALTYKGIDASGSYAEKTASAQINVTE